jgi:hypothetical protein
MHSQIILLQVQSKVRNSIAAMQALHDAWQNFVKFLQGVQRASLGRRRFSDRPRSYFASAKCPISGRAASESHWRMFPFRASPCGRQENGDKMRVMGIDPGLRNLGWGVIDVAGSRITHVANGICHSDGGRGLIPRCGCCRLHHQLTEVFRLGSPTRPRWNILSSTRMRWRR